jgi:hypothetical protein
MDLERRVRFGSDGGIIGITIPRAAFEPPITINVAVAVERITKGSFLKLRGPM